MTKTPMEQWTPRELREFRATLTAAQTRVRRLDQDVSWRGLGSKLTSICEIPSFAPGFVWDIRPFNEDLKLYVSVVNRSGSVGPGYRELAIDPATLTELLASLAEVRVVPWLPERAHSGLDGTSHTLDVAKGFATVSWSWWEDGPPEWRGLTGEVRALIARFKQLAPAPDLLDHPSLVAVKEAEATRVRRPFVWGIPLRERHEGICLACLPATILDWQVDRYLLAVHATPMTGELRRRLPEGLTIAAANEIVRLVNQKRPGVRCVPLSSMPDSLATDPDATYFELDRSSAQFAPLALAPMAIHVSSGLPKLRLELLAVT